VDKFRERFLVLSGYLITVLITIGIYIILALSLNIITGYAGQISLGHAAFMGIGAYTSALLYTKAGLSFWPSFVLAGLMAGLVGAVLAIPCLRVRDDFLAITTMGINFVIEAVFLYIPFFGAGMGIGGINPPSLFGNELGKPAFLALVVLVIFLTIAADRWLARSWIGLGWAAIREDEQAAGAMGIDVVRFKVLAFTLGSAGAGLAGSLYAHFLTFIMPVNFSFAQSMVILSMVVFGGIGTLRGPIVGAIVLGALPEISRPAMEYRTLLYGMLLLLLMRFQPDGILGEGSLVVRGWRMLVRGTRNAEPTTDNRQ
jgi:branched-chain amino acid transport system permease protein